MKQIIILILFFGFFGCLAQEDTLSFDESSDGGSEVTGFAVTESLSAPILTEEEYSDEELLDMLAPQMTLLEIRTKELHVRRYSGWNSFCSQQTEPTSHDEKHKWKHRPLVLTNVPFTRMGHPFMIDRTTVIEGFCNEVNLDREWSPSHILEELLFEISDDAVVSFDEGIFSFHPGMKHSRDNRSRKGGWTTNFSPSPGRGPKKGSYLVKDGVLHWSVDFEEVGRKEFTFKMDVTDDGSELILELLTAPQECENCNLGALFSSGFWMRLPLEEKEEKLEEVSLEFSSLGTSCEEESEEPIFQADVKGNTIDFSGWYDGINYPLNTTMEGSLSVVDNVLKITLTTTLDWEPPFSPLCWKGKIKDLPPGDYSVRLMLDKRFMKQIEVEITE